ncbi:MAG: hypothetical protein ACRDZP_09235 [Acidimicrobiales bacterium]
MSPKPTSSSRDSERQRLERRQKDAPRNDGVPTQPRHVRLTGEKVQKRPAEKPPVRERPTEKAKPSNGRQVVKKTAGSRATVPKKRPPSKVASSLHEGGAQTKPRPKLAAAAAAGAGPAPAAAAIGADELSAPEIPTDQYGKKPRRGRRRPERVDRELFGRPSGTHASAGRALGVGLLCFLLWGLFDANQLYHNAQASPEGTRRSVAMSLLRPVAAVTNALGLSGPVNSANTALHRNPPAPASLFIPPPPGGGSRMANDAGASGLAPRPHTHYGQAAGENSGARVWPPPLGQPTTAHPLVVLDIGDSVGADLGFGLGDIFTGDHYVDLVQKGVEVTGLARPDYFNWPSHLAADIHQFHPGAVVVMLGANDMQALQQNGNFIPLGTPGWWHDYAQRVSLIMSEATSSGAHVLWVGLPPMAGAAVTSPFAEQVNGIAKTEAGAHSGVSFVSSWYTLGGKKGKFTQFLSVGGREEQVRYSDGVHLAPAGWDLLAQSLVQPMQHDWGIQLHAK